MVNKIKHSLTKVGILVTEAKMWYDMEGVIMHEINSFRGFCWNFVSAYFRVT